jgi:[ribosomal protein S5]-alanine N-acetyltransferase
MLINTSRFALQDLRESDRAAFITYQMDPRYRRLYNFGDADQRKAQELFDLFLFISWQKQDPRMNFQLGIFERATGRLCGCAGLRNVGKDQETAVFGIELTPSDWGRFGLAVEVTSALLEHGFGTLDLQTIIGTTASGNRRVEKLALWLGADIIGRRDGPGWMAVRGWHEVDWALAREDWRISKGRRSLRKRLSTNLRHSPREFNLRHNCSARNLASARQWLKLTVNQ